MKRLVLGLAIVALAAFSARIAHAQAKDDFESEFLAFKKKVEDARKAAPPAPAAAAPPPASSAPLGAKAAARAAADEKSAPSPLAALAAPPAPASPAPMPSAESPLGPAANLPVGGIAPPAGGYALDPATQAQLDAESQASLEDQKRKIEEETFTSAMKALLPMKPENIRRLLENFKESRQAAETPIAEPAPKIAIETISLDPSQTPPVIKTSPVRVTTLTILDSTGAPWPIQDVSWAGKFDVVAPEEGGHVIRITPQTAHGMGNISIRLVDLITPVTFTLQSGLDEVYYRYDARIPKLGPLAKAPLIERGGLKSTAGTDENLVQILDGTPPSGAEKLKVEGVDGRTGVWRADGRIYLRTPLTLLSPSWDSSVMSADGMNVYTLNEAPVILLSDGGKMLRAHIAPDEAQP